MAAIDDLFPAHYTTVVADPPWNERGGGKIKRGADRHYPLMKTPEIVDLLVNDCEPLQQLNPVRSCLFLYVTNNFLFDGGDVMEALGFRYITCITWAKDRIGLGYYFRGQTEQILFGVRGSWPRDAMAGWSSTLLGGDLIPRPGRHSKKPRELQDMIERRFPGPYLELFARRERPHWTVWGNEV